MRICVYTLAVHWSHFVCGTCIQWQRLFARLPVLEARKMGMGATHWSNKSAACTCQVHGESINFCTPIDLWSECRWITEHAEECLSLWQLEGITPLNCLICPPVSVVNVATVGSYMELFSLQSSSYPVCSKIVRESKIHNTSGDTVSGCGPACTSLMSQSHSIL